MLSSKKQTWLRRHESNVLLKVMSLPWGQSRYSAKLQQWRGGRVTIPLRLGRQPSAYPTCPHRKQWHEWRDSNSQISVLGTDALPVEPHSHINAKSPHFSVRASKSRNLRYKSQIRTLPSRLRTSLRIQVPRMLLTTTCSMRCFISTVS